MHISDTKTNIYQVYLIRGTTSNLIHSSLKNEQSKLQVNSSTSSVTYMLFEKRKCQKNIATSDTNKHSNNNSGDSFTSSRTDGGKKEINCTYKRDI